MSHKKKGQLTDSPAWKTHLRRTFRRIFWKKEHLAEKYEINNQLRDSVFMPHEVDDTDKHNTQFHK